jgi:hypothetical protein
MPTDQFEAYKEAFKAAVDARRLEIENFWRRSLFFWGFIAATYAAFSKAETDFDRSILAHFGFFTSCCWYLINRGSKAWQEIWEQKVVKMERGERVYSLTPKIQPKWLGAGAYSVSKITTLLSLVTALGWIALIMRVYAGSHFRLRIGVASAVTLVLTILLISACRSSALREGF